LLSHSEAVIESVKVPTAYYFLYQRYLDAVFGGRFGTALLPKLFGGLYAVVHAGNMTRIRDLPQKTVLFSNSFKLLDVPSSKVRRSAFKAGIKPRSSLSVPVPEPYRQRLIDLVRSKLNLLMPTTSRSGRRQDKQPAQEYSGTIGPSG